MGIAEGARPRPGRSPTTIPTTSRNSSPVVAPPPSSRAASSSTSYLTRDNSEIVTESIDSLDDDLDAPRQAISTASGWASAPGVDPALRPSALSSTTTPTAAHPTTTSTTAPATSTTVTHSLSLSATTIVPPAAPSTSDLFALLANMAADMQAQNSRYARLEQAWERDRLTLTTCAVVTYRKHKLCARRTGCSARRILLRLNQLGSVTLKKLLRSALVMLPPLLRTMPNSDSTCITPSNGRSSRQWEGELRVGGGG